MVCYGVSLLGCCLMSRSHHPISRFPDVDAGRPQSSAVDQGSVSALRDTMASAVQAAGEEGYLAVASQLKADGHDHGSDHASHQGTFAGRPIEVDLIAAGVHNPLARQADPLPTQAGEQKRTVHGIEISGTDVSPGAMDAAVRVVAALLGANPDGAARMASAKVPIVIVPASTDLPDVAGLRILRLPPSNGATRAGAVGCTSAAKSSSCTPSKG